MAKQTNKNAFVRVFFVCVVPSNRTIVMLSRKFLSFSIDNAHLAKAVFDAITVLFAHHSILINKKREKEIERERKRLNKKRDKKAER